MDAVFDRIAAAPPAVAGGDALAAETLDAILTASLAGAEGGLDTRES